MERNELKLIIKKSFLTMQKSLPIKTGTMAFKATQLENGGDIIKISIKETIAPYSKELNNPSWKSYRFWEKSVENVFFKELEKQTGEKIKRGGE